MTIAYDHINVYHEWVVGIPETPDSSISDGVSFRKTFDPNGSIVLDLKDFPHEQLPSGGMSNVLSLSEMIMIELYAENYWPQNDATHFLFYRPDNTLIVEIVCPDGAEEPWWTHWWSSDWALIGHFGWEIDTPGEYYIVVKTAWGDARINYTVVDTSPPPLKYATVNVFGNGIARIMEDGLWLGDATNSQQVRVLLGGTTLRVEGMPDAYQMVEKITYGSSTTTNAYISLGEAGLPDGYQIVVYFRKKPDEVPTHKAVYFTCGEHGHYFVYQNGTKVLEMYSGDNGMREVYTGDRIKLTAYADAGYVFDKFTDSLGATMVNNVTIDVDALGQIGNITAHFSIGKKTIRVSATKGGNCAVFRNRVFHSYATFGTYTTIELSTGDSLGIVSEALDGYRFVKLCDCESCTTLSNVVLDVQNANGICDFTAHFEAVSQTYAFTASKTSGVGDYTTTLTVVADAHIDEVVEIWKHVLLGQDQKIWTGVIGTLGTAGYTYTITEEQTLYAVLGGVESNRIDFHRTSSGDGDGDGNGDVESFTIRADDRHDPKGAPYFSTVFINDTRLANETVSIFWTDSGINLEWNNVKEVHLSSEGYAEWDHYIERSGKMIGMIGFGCSVTDVGQCIRSNVLEYGSGSGIGGIDQYIPYLAVGAAALVFSVVGEMVGEEDKKRKK